MAKKKKKKKKVTLIHSMPNQMTQPRWHLLCLREKGGVEKEGWRCADTATRQPLAISASCSRPQRVAPNQLSCRY